MLETNTQIDLLVIGGGINGCGIAADAAGRGLSVILCESGDLASGTSSWSTKLIHGGLRYLEHYEFKLVHEALREREILLKKAPHLIHPLEFILPHEKHLRPAWMIRIGLFLYDHLGKRVSLPSSKKINLAHHLAGKALQKQFKTGFSYFDCRTDDARLVILNTQTAKNHGATILTHTRCINANRENDYWQVELKNVKTNEIINVKAKAIVNAAGPWVGQVLKNILHLPCKLKINLVKGSHIVVPKIFEGEHAYILQNKDGRIVFAIPYQTQFTLIGTTDVEFHADPANATISNEEITYLCNIINAYFNKSISPTDVAWSYSGVRALHGGDENHPEQISREYQLEVDDDNGAAAPVLSVFGGKLTTFRTLAEHALTKLKPYFPKMGPAWTATAFLPGGDLQGLSFNQFVTQLKNKYAWLPSEIIERYAGNYGSLSNQLLKNTSNVDDLGQYFGAGLYEQEVRYLIENEWAHSVDDIIWRRSKLGLFLNHTEQQKLKDFLDNV